MDLTRYPTTDDIPAGFNRPRFWYHPWNDTSQVSFPWSLVQIVGNRSEGPRGWPSLQQFHTLKNCFLPPRSARCWGGRFRKFFPPPIVKMRHVIDIFLGYRGWFSIGFRQLCFFKHATIWSLIVAQKSHRLDLFFNTKSMEEAIT